MTWDDLRHFLGLACRRRPSHAGHKFGVDHTTGGRRVEQLERSRDCRLLEATAERYRLAGIDQRLFAHAEGVGNVVAFLREEASGQGVRVSGIVRIGTPEGFGTESLAPRLGPLIEAPPDLDVELLALPRLPSLAKREADILVTLDPPQQGRRIAVRAGPCVAVLARCLARDRDLVRLLPQLAWKRTFWLTTHADWYRLRRIRAVWDFLRHLVDANHDFFLDQPARATTEAA